MAGTDDAPLGIMAALPGEAQGLFDEMALDPACIVETVGTRAYHRGKLWGRPCVISLAGIGKVAAATTVTAMIHRYGIGALLFTGVAGGLGHGVAIGDVVVADTLLQHDLDARPLFPRYEVPGRGRSIFPADPAMTDRLAAAVRDYLPLAPRPARLHRGLVISGDRFVNGVEAVRQLRLDLPDALAVEMEGAAVAQVCADYGIPFAVLRALSDTADDAAHLDFPTFLREIASHYAYEIVRRFIEGVGVR